MNILKSFIDFEKFCKQLVPENLRNENLKTGGSTKPTTPPPPPPRPKSEGKKEGTMLTDFLSKCLCVCVCVLCVCLDTHIHVCMLV